MSDEISFFEHLLRCRHSDLRMVFNDSFGRKFMAIGRAAHGPLAAAPIGNDEARDAIEFFAIGGDERSASAAGLRSNQHV